MCLLGAAFLPSRDSFCTAFLKHCGRAESLGITTCLECVNGGMQGHAPCEILPLNQIPFFVSVKFHGNLKLSQS